MTFIKTNVPGYIKDKKTNTIVPINVEDKIKQVQASRQKIREIQNLTKTVEELKQRVEILEQKAGWIL